MVHLGQSGGHMVVGAQWLAHGHLWRLAVGGWQPLTDGGCLPARDWHLVGSQQ